MFFDSEGACSGCFGDKWRIRSQHSDPIPNPNSYRESATAARGISKRQDESTIRIFKVCLCMGTGWDGIRGVRADLPDQPECAAKSPSSESPGPERPGTGPATGMGIKHPECPHCPRC